MASLVMLCSMCTKQNAASSETVAVEKNTSKETYDEVKMPRPTNKMANDFAGILGDSIRFMENDLRRYDKESPVRIVVVTMSTIGNNDPLQFATKLANYWGVGEKDKDNGILILVQPKTEKQKGQVAIALGRGVEKVLSDSDCQKVINTVMIPKLKGNDYYGAIMAGVENLVETLSDVMK